MKYLFVYLIIINLITLLIYGLDKYKATRNQWRISEKALIGLAVIGGGVGALLGMEIFRHKTKHLKFVIGIPVILIIWGAIIVYYYIKL